VPNPLSSIFSRLTPLVSQFQRRPSLWPWLRPRDERLAHDGIDLSRHEKPPNVPYATLSPQERKLLMQAAAAPSQVSQRESRAWVRLQDRSAHSGPVHAAKKQVTWDHNLWQGAEGEEVTDTMFRQPPGVHLQFDARGSDGRFAINAHKF
jgi:hypothetical protein